jgi:hypothetical protein
LSGVEGGRITATTSSSERRLRGSCLCGALRYTVADAFRYAAVCRCSNCRRATASPFKQFAGIEREKLALVAADDDRLIFGDDTGHDVHCGKCGSLLYSVVREDRFVQVATGTLVDAPAIQPSEHIFVESKAPWLTIADDLPQYRKHLAAAPGEEPD